MLVSMYNTFFCLYHVPLVTLNQIKLLSVSDFYFQVTDKGVRSGVCFAMHRSKGLLLFSLL